MDELPHGDAFFLTSPMSVLGSRDTYVMFSQEGLTVSGGTVQIRRVRTGSLADLGEKSHTFRVRIDGVQVALLRIDEEVVIPVSSGRHRVQLRNDLLSFILNLNHSETFDIEVQPGEAIRFECRCTKDHSKILLRRLEDSSTSAPSDSGVVDARVLGVTQMTRTEEWLGEDVRLIDNSASPAPVTRSLKASREWTRTLTLGETRTQSSGGHVGVNLLWLSAKGSIEAELQRTLSLAIGSTHLFEEEIGVTVPERTAVRIVLGWKRIWQCGEARVLLPDRSVHIVPYRVVVSVTFDQKIQDVTSLPDG
ncbi:hypothetical protein OG520_45250 (plasmid) [Streptomyces sp. NBC_00984]|uniref:hypothetical protein n=1 Tax=Streptomyces sp. NBC_00984 TaxID=2903700 RepID=UPI002F91A7B5|nr:hypothetical protein OG520_43985 [Streptomyces sp. NBC_00984]WSX34121.1 hypothetical protein OG520_45250 [Streptomyces sp. NBC_00984]